MKWPLCVTWITCFAFFHGGVVGQTTLNEAIIQALSKDPTIYKVHADVTEARGFEKTVKSDLLPQLSIEGRFGAAMHDQVAAGSEGETLLNRRGSVLGRQQIWDGGFNWYRWQDARQRIVAKELLDKAQRENTAIGIVEAYLDVIRARKQIELAQQSVAAHLKVLDLSKKRAEALTLNKVNPSSFANARASLT